jgi:hypothetical protein
MHTRNLDGLWISLNRVINIASSILVCCTEDCVARGIDLARYEMAVKKYVMTIEAKSELAALQQDIVRKLSYHGGRMKLSALKAAVEAKMYDTYFWWKAYSGLHTAGHIAETPEVGKAAGSNGSLVTLIQGFHEKGDDE